jgi:hypothetical protein
MPSRSNYWLKVTGALKGGLSEGDLETVRQLFQGVFPPDAPGASGTWPESFRFPDWPDNYKWPTYNVCIWDSSVEDIPFTTVHAGEPLTLLNFHAELADMRRGNLYKNYEDMKWELEWFYSYCRQGWYLQMMRKIDELNQRLKDMGLLVEPINVRDWCWGCGNGGGE